VAGQVPQLTFGPHPLLTSPQVAPLHDGGVHAVHTLFTQLDAPVQLPHCTVPLPQALVFAPQSEPTPPSASLHSGGGAAHSPATHVWPVGHPHGLVCPQPSVIVPQKFRLPLEQASGAHDMPASVVVCGTHMLLTQSLPGAQPPHPIGTPQASTPMTPHLPAQLAAAG
jgi:hypothetical protein